MFKNFFKKKSRKDVFFLGISLLIIIISGALIFLSLTFVMKNINLVLKPIPPATTDLHFNISEAEILFPSSNQY